MAPYNHVFKGHKSLLGKRYVTYKEVELSTHLSLFNHSRDGFDWGYMGSGPLQLSFCILYEVAGEEIAKRYKTEYAKEVISKITSKDWNIEAKDVKSWVGQQKEQEQEVSTQKETKVKKVSNVVKDVCKELGITQKKLAKILEIPEGTVSSWAVKNEIPRLGKKAIEFYMQSQKNEQIVNNFKNLLSLVNTDPQHKIA
jgi:DNA-binding transcriptional regulator YiaG